MDLYKSNFSFCTMTYFHIYSVVFAAAGVSMKCMRSKYSADLRPEVNCKNGHMLGRYRKTQSGAKFSSFTKIPYGLPPTGNLRFAHPQAAPPWQGVLDASKQCPKPVQNNYVTGKTGLQLTN